MKRITIKEDFRIPGTEHVLEAGDRIDILTERIDYFLTQTITSHLQKIDVSDKRFVASTLFLSIVGSLDDLYENPSDVEEVRNMIRQKL